MPIEAPEYKTILAEASNALAAFSGRILDVLEVACPPDLDYAVHLSKVVSKLSPIIGNMLEYGAISHLNEKNLSPHGKWIRQDPGFPDTIFQGTVAPTPGIEIKTWFPLATEITARFKESATHVENSATNVAMLAWVPDAIIFGHPRILDVWIADAKSVADARDRHYHNPPDYLVIEPEDTAERTRTCNKQTRMATSFRARRPRSRKRKRSSPLGAKRAARFLRTRNIRRN